MRAYFLVSKPSPKATETVGAVFIPTNEHLFIYTNLDLTKSNWSQGNAWRCQAYALRGNEGQVRTVLEALPAYQTVPDREWSVEIPDDVMRQPLGRFQGQDAKAPVNKWFAETIGKIPGMDPGVGRFFARGTETQVKEALVKRSRDILEDGLAGIVHRPPQAAAKAAAKSKVTVLSGPKSYTRPNGQVYYARKWGKHSDVEVLRKGRETMQFALLKSPPGTGKTACTEAAFGDDLYTIIGSGDTEVSNFVGTYVPDSTQVSGFRWVDGPLVRAMEEGKPLLIDEIGLVDPKVLSPLYPLMDGRDELNIDANPDRGTVKAKKGFYIIGAYNPHAPGVRMSEALLSRFNLKAEMTTDYGVLENIIGVNADIVRLASNLAAKVAEGEISWAPQFRELLTFHHTEEIFGYEFALSNLLAEVPEDELEEVKETMVAVIGSSHDVAKIL